MTTTFGRREGDTMPADSDHDLLVRLDTKVNLLLENQSLFTQQVTQANKELSERVARLEVKDSKDSGKFDAISADVQRSLGNHEEIVKLQGQVGNLQEELKALRSKANIFDWMNAAGVIVSGIIGSIFGSR